VFVFQYNPEFLTREITYLEHGDSAALPQGHKDGSERLVERIYLTLELDAVDQMGEPGLHRHALENGLLPSLAVLESMVYPSSSIVVFQWGPRRSIPVRLTGYRVREEAFDGSLNPVRARVDLCMQVLGLSDFEAGSLGLKIFTDYLDNKRELAKLYHVDVV
jgi:hypothetical protein